MQIIDLTNKRISESASPSRRHSDWSAAEQRNLTIDRTLHVGANKWIAGLAYRKIDAFTNKRISESTHQRIRAADIFGIYGKADKRINHVGLVKEIQGKYLVTIEGNSNDRVESRRRHLSTIYALADWM